MYQIPGWIVFLIGGLGIVTIMAASFASRFRQGSFRFTVEKIVTGLDPSCDVVVAGTIEAGSVRVGDIVKVYSREGALSATILGIESPKGELEEAMSGQTVGLRLPGLRPDQLSKGDRVAA